MRCDLEKTPKLGLGVCMKSNKSAMPTRSMQKMNAVPIKNGELSYSDIKADLTKQDSDNYRTLEIKINLPKRITSELKHNSRDVMLFHMIRYRVI